MVRVKERRNGVGDSGGEGGRVAEGAEEVVAKRVQSAEVAKEVAKEKKVVEGAEEVVAKRVQSAGAAQELAKEVRVAEGAEGAVAAMGRDGGKDGNGRQGYGCYGG